MTYTHLTTNELTIIAHSSCKSLKRTEWPKWSTVAPETVYRVYRYLETGASIADYQDHYMRNKQRCGRKRTQLSLAELTYINDKIAQGWTPDTIIGRAERPISCNLRTLYRMFERGQFGFDVRSLPMQVSGTRMAMSSAAGSWPIGAKYSRACQGLSALCHWIWAPWSWYRPRQKAPRGGNDPDRTPIEGRKLYSMCTKRRLMRLTNT